MSERRRPGVLEQIASDPDFKAVMLECDRLLEIKGHDYTQGQAKSGTDEGRLKNFRDVGRRLGLEPRQVLAVYLSKHLEAIETFLRGKHLESEGIDGRIVDAINYLLLLAKLVRVERREAEKVAVPLAVSGR